ncbi:energy transducer TonB [Methylobacterium sp. J-026]|uniref:energy transducer TonB n=1 Tax=Methylobacterium sp. J-026 TaxID=2836624 RepID=UPI001FB91F5E|nr:energy transducer TonB [Methylobacterium sp. J-026]MCJ2137915.1 energy transducer TonB [Methylobacterium sp. J-026]
MPSRDPTYRLLAAGFGLGGLGYLMSPSEPDLDDILIGLGCLVLCGGFSAIAPAKRPGQVETLPPEPAGRAIASAEVPKSHRLLRMEVPQSASRLPEAPAHRRRDGDRRPPGQS